MSSNDRMVLKKEEDDLLLLIEKAKKKERVDVEFKRELNISTKAQKAEFAKDVALQANLPTGGNIIYGIDNEGIIIGIHENIPSEDDLSNILINRLMFAPPGIEIIPSRFNQQDETYSQLVWIKIPPCTYDIPTCFLDSNGNWKMPIRINTTTKYLSPPEAISYYRQREEKIAPKFVPSISFGGEPDKIEEKLESNLFPFIELPKNIWMAKIKVRTYNDIDAICDNKIPYMLWNEFIISFRNKDICDSIFKSVIINNGMIERTEKYSSKRGFRQIFIALLNKELVVYGKKLGLSYDDDSKKLFFPCEKNEPITIKWKSFTRQAHRIVVGYKKGNDEKTNHWYHFGFSFKVEDLKDYLALIIDPSWVFTFDGKRMIHSYRVAPIASKRISREDNARVLYNKHFWLQYLANENKLIILDFGKERGVISTESIFIKMGCGISSDKIFVLDDALDLDSDIPEPVPVIEEEDKEEKEIGGDESGLF